MEDDATHSYWIGPMRSNLLFSSIALMNIKFRVNKYITQISLFRTDKKIYDSGIKKHRSLPPVFLIFGHHLAFPMKNKIKTGIKNNKSKHCRAAPLSKIFVRTK